MGNKPISSLSMDDIPNDPGVVTLLTAASLRTNCTEQERRELCDMAKRLRQSKQKILDEKQAHQDATLDVLSPLRLVRRSQKVDDFREYALAINLEELDNSWTQLSAHGSSHGSTHGLPLHHGPSSPCGSDS